VTHQKSRQFNCSLHDKISHIDFEDKFLINLMRMLKIFFEKTAKEIFYQIVRNEHWTTFCESLEHSVQQNALHKRSAVFVLFLVLSSRVETKLGWSETVCIHLVEFSLLFPVVDELSKSIKNYHSYSRKWSGTFFHSLRCNDENFHEVRCLTVMTSSSH